MSSNSSPEFSSVYFSQQPHEQKKEYKECLNKLVHKVKLERRLELIMQFLLKKKNFFLHKFVECIFRKSRLICLK